MKYLFVLHTISCGGAEKYIINLANALARIDKNSIVYLYVFDDSYFYKNMIDSKVVLIQDYNKRDAPFTLKWYFDFYIKFGIKLLIRMRKIKFDFIISGYEELSEIAITFLWLLKRNKNETKFISFIQSNISYQLERSHKYLAAGKKIIIKLIREKVVDHHFVVNKKVQDDLVNYFEINSSSVLPPIINLSFNSMNKDDEKIKLFKPYIISLGRIDENKNHSLMVDFFDLLKNKDIKLYIFGKIVNKITYTRLIVKINKLKLNDRIFIFNPVQNIWEALKNAEAYICTSLNETIHLGILEAIKIGTPVISVPFDGYENIINEEIAFVSDSYDPIELSNLANTIFTMSQKEKYEFIENAKKYTDRFSNTIVVDNFKRSLNLI